MASHLTRGDIKFLAGVRRDDNVRQLAELVELTREIGEAADARGVEPDLSALDSLDDDDVIDDPQQLDAIRAGLRSQLGTIGRGEHHTEGNDTDE